MMSKLTDNVKSVLVRHDCSHVPDKQIHRWEGEGGAVFVPKPRRQFEERVAPRP